MSRYQIWDKTSQILTPVGEVLTAEQWKDRYPMAKLDNITLVIGGGVINGSFCSEYSSFVSLYDTEMKTGMLDNYKDGIPNNLSKQEVLDYIEEFENERNIASRNVVSTEERIAAALEAQVLMSMPDAE